MKKFLLLLLSVVFALPLVACTNTKSSQNNNTGIVGTSVRGGIDTFIQDSNGVDKCFWEDGKVKFDDYNSFPFIQSIKSATLSIQTEYDMWFSQLGRDFDFVNYFEPPKFICDEAKIEIKPNSDKENHFILKVLQPCKNEKILVKLIDKRINDEIMRYPSFMPLTISTEE